MDHPDRPEGIEESCRFENFRIATVDDRGPDLEIQIRMVAFGRDPAADGLAHGCQCDCRRRMTPRLVGLILKIFAKIETPLRVWCQMTHSMVLFQVGDQQIGPPCRAALKLHEMGRHFQVDRMVDQ